MITIRYDLYLNRYMTNILQKWRESHIQKHGHKHVHRFLHHVNTIQHIIMHAWELVVILCLWWGALLFANYNTGYEIYNRSNMSEVSQYLLTAEKNGQPDQSNLISTRAGDSSINNTFTPWYCTYGAARISPEFFPYSGDTQQRTRGGNAIDRCENAAATGFDVGSNPRVGALIVYNPGNGISVLGHVGKVMFYNNRTSYMIIRDMNRIGRNIMSDHRDTTKTANVKCYIYPKKETTQTVVTPTVPVVTPTIPVVTPTVPVVTPTVPVVTPTVPVVTPTIPVVTPTIPVVTPTIPVVTPTIPVVTPTIPVVTPTQDTHNSATNQEPEKTPITNRNTNPILTQNIELNLDNISDIAKHFMDNYDFTITKTSKEYPNVGDTIILTINAKEKTTNNSYLWILPFVLNIITSNNNLSSNTSRIQLLPNNDMEISIKVNYAGSSTIILSIDDQKIAKIPVSIVN